MYLILLRLKNTLKQNKLKNKEKTNSQDQIYSGWIRDLQEGTAIGARLPLSCCRTGMAVTNYVPESGGPLPGPNALTMLLRLHKIVHSCPRGKYAVHPGTMWSLTRLNRRQRAQVFFGGDE